MQLRSYQSIAADFLYEHDRAMILAVDGREFLILRCRGEAPLMTALPEGAAPPALPDAAKAEGVA
jgi:hypothetical protein